MTLYNKAKRNYDFASDISGNVWRAAHFKVLESLQQVEKYRNKVAVAKAKNLGAAKIAHEEFLAQDGIEQNEDEARFYAEIRRNAIFIHQNSTQGLNVVDEMKFAIIRD